MHLIEYALCKLFPYTDIKREGTDDVYLRRWFVYPRNKDFSTNKLKPRFYIHKFYRGDEDPHLHDHPWSFTSFLLTRGYWEETPITYAEASKLPVRDYMNNVIALEGELRLRTWYPRFSLLKRPATTKHRVIIRDGVPVWTIVKTGIKERSWGFWISDKFCHWQNYRDGVCWCDVDEQAVRER